MLHALPKTLSPRAALRPEGTGLSHPLDGNPLAAGIMSGGGTGGRARVTREMVYARTREMAVQAGRAPLQISQGDYELARRELTGESDMDRQEAVLDAPSATLCWRAGVIRAAAVWENEGGRLADRAA